MKDIRILGTGCAKCVAMLKLIQTIAEERHFQGNIRKVEDIMDILEYGVMSTPAVVIDGKVVLACDVPDRKTVEGWFDTL